MTSSISDINNGAIKLTENNPALKPHFNSIKTTPKSGNSKDTNPLVLLVVGLCLVQASPALPLFLAISAGFLLVQYLVGPTAHSNGSSPPTPVKRKKKKGGIELSEYS